MCDADTNLVVVKAKMAKSIPEVAEIETDTLDELYFVIRRNGRNKSGQLLLLSTRILQVSRQASG